MMKLMGNIGVPSPGCLVNAEAVCLQRGCQFQAIVNQSFIRDVCTIVKPISFICLPLETPSGTIAPNGKPLEANGEGL